MTERTITVPTLDAGPVTISEPDWCTGQSHEFPLHRSDISHQGPDVTITVGTVHGPRELMTLNLSQWPFGTGETGVYESVRLADGDHYAYDVHGLESLVTDLLEAAGRVRLVARRLASEYRRGGR